MGHESASCNVISSSGMGYLSIHIYSIPTIPIRDFIGRDDPKGKRSQKVKPEGGCAHTPQGPMLGQVYYKMSLRLVKSFILKILRLMSQEVELQQKKSSSSHIFTIFKCKMIKLFTKYNVL